MNNNIQINKFIDLFNILILLIINNNYNNNNNNIELTNTPTNTQINTHTNTQTNVQQLNTQTNNTKQINVNLNEKNRNNNNSNEFNDLTHIITHEQLTRDPTEHTDMWPPLKDSFINQLLQLNFNQTINNNNNNNNSNNLMNELLNYIQSFLLLLKLRININNNNNNFKLSKIYKLFPIKTINLMDLTDIQLQLQLEVDTSNNNNYYQINSEIIKLQLIEEFINNNSNNNSMNETNNNNNSNINIYNLGNYWNIKTIVIQKFYCQYLLKLKTKDEEIVQLTNQLKVSCILPFIHSFVRSFLFCYD